MLAVKICLIGGGTCLAIPSFLHLKSFNGFYEIVDVYKISETQPILDCNDHGLHYRVYLTAKEGGSWDATNAQSSITLSIVNAKDSNLSWGGTRKTQNEQWSNWKLRISGKEIHLKIPNTNKSHSFSDSDYMSLICKNGKVISKLDNDGRETTISANSSGSTDGVVIGFELKNGSSCAKNGKRTECEISFKTDNNLDWKNGFKPKAYFYS